MLDIVLENAHLITLRVGGCSSLDTDPAVQLF